jgi:GMP synthase (glutamine-hydrolysing)
LNGSELLLLKTKIADMKHILIIKNNTHEGAGILELILIKHHIQYTIIDLDMGDKFPAIEHYDAFIVLEGPDSANDNNEKMMGEISFIKHILNANKPYLGICLGLQTLIKAAGGNVVKSPVKEIGFRGPDQNYFSVELTAQGKKDALFKDLPYSLNVFHLHGETVELPANNEIPITLLGEGKFCRNQIVKVGEKAYGLQCHFELTREMFDIWITEDPDLKSLDDTKLHDDFNNTIDSYLQTGHKLFENFLTATGIIQIEVVKS